MESKAEHLEGQHLAHQKPLNLHVRYISARQPFVDPNASLEETLAALKVRVLAFFKLVEGGADGGTKTYYFSLDAVALTDLSATLGSLTEGQHNLKLDLLERFEQG